MKNRLLNNIFGEEIMKSQHFSFAFLFSVLLLLQGCIGGEEIESSENISEGPITIEVWHTFASESKEEETFY